VRIHEKIPMIDMNSLLSSSADVDFRRRRPPLMTTAPCRQSSSKITLTGPVYLLVLSLSRSVTNSSLCSASTQPPLSWFLFPLLLESCFKSVRHQQCRPLIGSTAVTSHATVWLVMHVVLGFLLRIFM